MMNIIVPLSESLWKYLIVLLILSVSCDSKKTVETEDSTYYTCPMHPEIKKNAPGSCPICKMDLVKKTVSPQEQQAQEKDSLNLSSVNSTVLSAVKAIKPIRKRLPFRIQTKGYIAYDARRIHTISSRISGRIERLYVKYNFQQVRKGQALFQIFSAELLAAQNDYLYVKNNDPDMIAASKGRLILLGMSEKQINNLKYEGHQNATTTIYSPYSGYVIEKLPQDEGLKDDNQMATPSMENPAVLQNSNMETKSNLSLKEGGYIVKGEVLFKVVNTDVVWGILEVYSDQISYIRPNHKVHIMLEGTDNKLIGKVDFIEPSYKAGNGTTRLRIYLDNKSQDLKIGNLITGEIDLDQKEGLWIPLAAIYDLGLEKIVFVKNGGTFKTRRITTGITSGGEVAVLDGLKEEDLIAENAQFMIDSESFVK